jgi:hypothetical protein
MARIIAKLPLSQSSAEPVLAITIGIESDLVVKA